MSNDNLPKGEGMEQARSRRRVYVVMNNKTVWKGMFFMKREHAFNAVTMFYAVEFKKEGKDKIRMVRSKELFTLKTLDEYTKLKDIPYSENTKRFYGL